MKKGWTDKAREASAALRKGGNYGGKTREEFLRGPGKAPASLSERVEAHRQSKNLTLTPTQRAAHPKLGSAGYK